MRPIRLIAIALCMGAVFAPQAAEATSYRLALGANYWFEETAIFDATLAITTRVAPRLSVGGRFGGGIATSPSTFLMPIDLVLRGDLPRFYVEGMAGPWLFFEGEALRAHAAFGMGIRAARGLTVGFELGYLDPNGILGFKLAFQL